MLKTTRLFLRMLAFRNVAFTSDGDDQSACAASWNHACNGCAASCFPGLSQKTRSALREMILIETPPHHILDPIVGASVTRRRDCLSYRAIRRIARAGAILARA